MARRMPGWRVRKRGSLGTRNRCAKVDDAPFALSSWHPLHAEGDHRQRLGDVGQQMMARGRQRHAARPALKQLDAEPLFERVNAVADRARGQAEFVRGFGKTFVPGSGFKQPKRRQRRNRDRHRGKLARVTGPMEDAYARAVEPRVRPSRTSCS